ncbi:PREDICTED: uncharacterized protein LOC104825015 [Tarenaya hassleriana]|uniref:uncharacterized protein LOC104825015 n=1 Tax=Tarenaya hassleriana TaxID=28532 RepID=UPI00053C2930|nr:PREDICTED: uncharacterized protein LOC104825015 [Tarenaya hassleriana]
MEKTLWENLPLLVRANSKESVEGILKALWRSRKTGLSASDRLLFRDLLQLETDADLDPSVNDFECCSSLYAVRFRVLLKASGAFLVWIVAKVLRLEIDLTWASYLIPLSFCAIGHELVLCLRILIRRCV